MLLITGTSGKVACWNQRAAGPPNEGLLWDYHVVLLVQHHGWTVWDLDTHLACPSPANEWLESTFPFANEFPLRIRPRMLMVPAAEWIRDLWTDRSHMRTSAGDWTKPPPPWDPPHGTGTTLGQYLDGARAGLSESDLRSLFSTPQ